MLLNLLTIIQARLPFNYLAYDYNIQSEFEIEELIPGGNGQDISIHFGKIPENLNNTRIKTRRFEISPLEVIYNIEDVARYYIIDGKEVIIEKNQEVSNDEIKLYLLGFSFGILLHQRKEFILHANALNIGGKGILIAGPSGAGKSTLTAGFIKKGYKLLTDDLAPIRIIDDSAYIIPGLPRLKLYIDSIDNMDFSKKNIARLKKDVEKYNLPLPDDHSSKPVRAHKLYILDSSDSQINNLRDLNGMIKFKTISEQVYLKQLADFIWDKEQYFSILSTFSSIISASFLNQFKKWTDINNIIDLILNDINKTN